MAAVSGHERAAQEAGEQRLEEYLADENGLCECTTCLVREVLDAAWPHLRALAIEDHEEANGE
jgi:hypothetical protein